MGLTPALARRLPVLVGLVGGAGLVSALLVPADDGDTVSGREASETVQVGEGAGTPGSADPDAGGTGAVAQEGSGGGANGVSSSGTGGGSGGGPAAPEEGRRATERGVTADTITIGATVFDASGGTGLGFAFPGLDPQVQEDAYRAYVDLLNAGGGINGRKVALETRRVDLLDPDAARATCLSLTEDAKVFAVLAFAGDLCYTEEHETLQIAQAHLESPDFERRSAGRFFAYNMPGLRALASYAAEYDRLGVVKGRKIGVLFVDDQDIPEMVRDGLVATLTRAGHEVVHQHALSVNPSTAASQIPVAVQQMRSKGVDTVWVGVDIVAGTNFVQTAQSQGWRPRYLASDWGQMSSDFSAQAMPESFDGAVAITALREAEQNLPTPRETASSADCRRRFTQQTKRPLAYGDDTYVITVSICGLVDLFAAGARAAGPQLTTPAVSAALQRLGPVSPPVVGPGSFTPGKFGAADTVMTQVWHFDCACWIPADDFHRAAF